MPTESWPEWFVFVPLALAWLLVFLVDALHR